MMKKLIVQLKEFFIIKRYSILDFCLIVLFGTLLEAIWNVLIK